jgi:hypothetical protein
MGGGNLRIVLVSSWRPRWCGIAIYSADLVHALKKIGVHIYFICNNDGDKEHVAWAGSDDGILVFDFDNDNNITRTNEVSFLSYKEGAKTYGSP